MLRKFLGAVVLWVALTGCSGPQGVCELDSDCGPEGQCEPTTKLCFQSGSPFVPDSGVQDAGDPELDGGQCSPGCAPYEACKASGCVARYTALTVIPADGGLVDGGVLPVQAQLVLAPNVLASFPSSLDFRVTLTDGGAGGTVTPGSANGGVYTATWTPPAEGQFLLTAAYPTAGGPSTTVWLTVDTTPPAFNVRVPPVPVAMSDAGTTYLDPGASDAGTFWRRDQMVPVEIRTNEPHLEPGTVMVALVGLDGGPVPAASVVPFTTDCDAGYCAVANVELWKPAFDVFRGQMTVQVQASDRAGNAGTGSAPVNVTRWKWRHDMTIANNNIVASPAIGNTGFVYVGTTNGTNNDGYITALSPEGQVVWVNNSGSIVASPAVGDVQPSGHERVYIAPRKGTVSRVGYYDFSTDGGFLSLCGDSSGLVQSSLAVARVDAGFDSETVYGVFSGRAGGTLFAARPDTLETDVVVRCPIVASVGDVFAPGTMAAVNNGTVFANQNGDMKFFALNSNGSWGTPGSISLNVTPFSLAVAHGSVWGGSQDGKSSKLFSVPLDGGPLPSFPTLPANAWNVSVGAADAGVVAVGLENARLYVLELGDGGTRTIDTAGEVIRGAPVWGAGGYVYTAVATNGTIQARQPLETVRWEVVPGEGSAFNASANLDCSRAADGGVLPGRPGVLYAASANGRVYALIVDSPGLDPAAPWPRYQHDSRNTGNPATPILSCQ
jgi:hypothetical protein